MKLASRILRKIGFKSAAWDEEFKTDYWDQPTKDDPIYPVLEKYPGALLELGCGTGNTPLETLRSAYTGIDISPVAISKARARNPYHEFHVAAMEDYIPKQKYGVILFRESIYYVKRIDELLTRLQLYLAPGGVFIARICDRKRHWDVIGEIDRNWRVKTIMLDTGGVIMVFNIKRNPFR